MNELSFSQDLAKYNRVMADLADAAGARGDHGKVFVKKQAGMLVETLMKISPPLNRAKSRQNVAGKVKSKFNILGGLDINQDVSTSWLDLSFGERPSTGGVKWYLWTPHSLIGVLNESDMTGANDDELYKLYLRTTKKGQINAGNRGKQAIRIWQKVTVKKGAATRVIARIIKHFGRLKAGYLPSFDSLQSSGNIFRPPQWVMAHRSGARGRFQDETSAPQKPSVVIINFAKGVSKTSGIVHRALAIRLKAMKADMQLYIRGVKQKYAV